MLTPAFASNAASVCLACLSVYYLTASVFLARSSIPELQMMPLNVSTAVSVVPAGLVRKRGKWALTKVIVFFLPLCDSYRAAHVSNGGYTQE